MVEAPVKYKVTFNLINTLIKDIDTDFSQRQEHAARSCSNILIEMVKNDILEFQTIHKNRNDFETYMNKNLYPDEKGVDKTRKDKPQFTIIEGNIGSGKSTVASHLFEKVELSIILIGEGVDIIRNFGGVDYLSRYYMNPHVYAFSLQLGFLYCYHYAYIEAYKYAQEHGGIKNFRILGERGFYSVLYTFTFLMLRKGYLSTIQFHTIHNLATYLRRVREDMFDINEDRLNFKYIFMKAEPHVCLQRIITRSRSAEIIKDEKELKDNKSLTIFPLVYVTDKVLPYGPMKKMVLSLLWYSSLSNSIDVRPASANALDIDYLVTMDGLLDTYESALKICDVNTISFPNNEPKSTLVNIVNPTIL